MSETMSSQRKPSANKNIKKLRTLTVVCNLARSWQQWICENEEKQASEPTGWAPDSIDKDKAEKQEPKKPASIEKKTKTSQDNESGTEDSRIKTKQVVKTVTRDVQEKGAGIEFLTNRICKDPAEEELDRMLKKTSPTLRRNCSNMVSELKQGWKVAGNERNSENQENAEERDTDLSSNRIKRPSSLGSKTGVEDANKTNARSGKYSAVGSLKSRWQNWASEHNESQKLNPFSEDFDYEFSMSLRLRKGEEGYGRPKEGSKTAERAKRAEAHIHREIEHMCFIIRTMADPDPDGYVQITFGELFDRYVRISDKVVGILMRARKHGKVHFEGEMLWQGRDDGVIITLLV
ncbi:actin binding Rho activating protein b [Tachysurus fulvidraco]|uniref:actin binding Rho activating protein b n=1 Tax=Tachysurus fulvidraco TaxID=1234273 RepID=UPI000F4F441B|nr:actin binding Rho activating protein b [Tachysurus fulvidraco]